MASRVVRRRTQNAFLYAAMALSFAVFVFPLLWVLSTSLKTVPELFAAPPILVPSDPQWGNFLHVIETTGVLVYMRNSLVIVLGTIVLVALIAVPSAYALSRFAFRGRTVYMRGVLALQLISPIIVAVPLYRLFVALGLINNIAALIFMFSVGPLIAGALMLLADRLLNAGFYLPAAGGDPLLFQHLRGCLL